jgi:hypothetical protein
MIATATAVIGIVREVIVASYDLSPRRLRIPTRSPASSPARQSQGWLTKGRPLPAEPVHVDVTP